MLVRNCAGGVVFFEDKVFLLKNDKGEWIFPKGVIRSNEMPTDVAVRRVNEEAGVNAEIISTVGRTNYEFYSVTRQKPVCNKIIWYVMKSLTDEFELNKEENFLDGGYYTFEDAMEKITYSQDKSLLNLCFTNMKNQVAV